MISAGMIKAILTLLTFTNLVSKDSSIYYFLSFISDAGMYFLPIMAAYTAAKKFNCNPFLGMFLVAALLHPNFTALVNAGEPVELFGISVKLAIYPSNTIPAILCVWGMSYVERFFERIIPDMVKVFLVPTLTIIVSGPIAFIAIAPIGAIIGDGLAYVFNFLNNNVSWLLPAIWGGLGSILVMTGMHYSLSSIFGTMYALLGYETAMMPGLFVANIAQGGATFAVALRTKNKEFKQLASSSALTAVIGVTEPALYGVTLKLKKPLIAAMIGGATGGLFCGLK